MYKITALTVKRDLEQCAQNLHSFVAIAQAKPVTTQIKILAQFERHVKLLTNKHYTKYRTLVEGSKTTLRLQSYGDKGEMN